MLDSNLYYVIFNIKGSDEKNVMIVHVDDGDKEKISSFIDEIYGTSDYLEYISLSELKEQVFVLEKAKKNEISILKL